MCMNKWEKIYDQRSNYFVTQKKFCVLVSYVTLIYSWFDHILLSQMNIIDNTTDRDTLYPFDFAVW